MNLRQICKPHLALKESEWLWESAGRHHFNLVL